MPFRTWPVAAAALGGLVVLVVFSVLAASRRAEEIYTNLDQLNGQYHLVEAKLRRLRSDVLLSGIFIRDYLLEADRARAAEYRDQLTALRTRTTVTFGELRQLTRGRFGTDDQLLRLEASLQQYWQSHQTLFGWTSAERLSRSATFLRREVLPRREAVLSIAKQIEELNNTTLSVQRAAVTRQHTAFRRDLYNLLWRSVLLGVLVALTAVIRLRILERRSEAQRLFARDAERQMRQLSQQLVATQEEERKKLSRELHDHVGQVLTALRMELGAIDRMRSNGETRLARAVAECRQLVDNMVRTVRDLALGLRPTMLDDFGLQPALEWHVRDFTRRYGLPVQLDVTGTLESLPDNYRTCVYRVVQEALTNCIRHAAATHVHVSVSGAAHGLDVSITDDGQGIDPARRHTGLGLRGIEERVRDLGGTLAVESSAGHGTSLVIRLPSAIGALPEELTLARSAG